MDASPRFDAELFDRTCAALGLVTEEQRADHVGVNVSTLHRFRKGEMGPRLEVARRIARRIDLTVEQLWPEN